MPVSERPSPIICEESVNPIQEISLLIGRLDSLIEGEETVERLVRCGPPAIPLLGAFLLEGRPRKIFQPRRWAVEALARLGAKNILLEYLFLPKDVADPEDRFGEEAVESAAARFLSAWPDDDMFQRLLELSENHMLIGLIETLADYRRAEAMPYFERALEDDYYRLAAKNAFVKMGALSRETLVSSAITPKPHSSSETPSSLRRRRTAVAILSEIGILAEDWRILKKLTAESDVELVVNVSKLATDFASEKERGMIVRRLRKLAHPAPWDLQEEIKGILIVLQPRDPRKR